MKRKLSLVVVCTLLLTAMPNTTYGESSYYPLTQFIIKATAEDPEMKTLEQELDVLKKELEEIEKSNKKRSKEHDNADEYVAVYMDLEYAPYAKKMAISKAERAISQRKKALEKAFTKQYYALKNADDDVIEKRREMEKAEKDYALKVKSFDKGLISALILKQYEVAKLSAENGYDLAVRALDLQKMQVNKALNIDLTSNLILPSVIPTNIPVTAFDVSKVDVEKLAEVVSAKEAYDLAAYKLDVYERHMYNSKPQLSDKARHYGSPTGYFDVKKEVAKALETYTKAKREAAIKLKMASNDCLNASSNVRIMTLQYEKAELTYEAAKVKNSLGLVTDAEKDDAYYAQLQAFYAKRDAERELYYKWFDFEGNFF